MTMSAANISAVTDTLPDETVDAVVIGGGAAGLNGALMLARSRRSVVVVDGGAPRNAPAAGVHGLLGHDGVPPADLLRTGRAEVRGYGGQVIDGTVASAAPIPQSRGGYLRFAVTLADCRTLHARRLLIATGARDILPEIPGLARHWGRGLVHCPYCHGWEVRDEPIGVLAVGPASVHQALLFSQLTDDLTYFAGETELDPGDRARFAARGIRIEDTPVAAIESTADGNIAGVWLADGRLVSRRVLTVATSLQPRTEGLDRLRLPVEDLPAGMGRKIASGLAGQTEVPGVWVAGNATEPFAQVGASAAAGALAGAHMNADLVTADTDAALAADQRAGASR
jgi:thioredoxin reductase